MNCHATRLILDGDRARAKETVNYSYTRTDQFRISREARVRSKAITYTAISPAATAGTTHWAYNKQL